MWQTWNALETIPRRRFCNLIPRKINGLIHRPLSTFRKIVSPEFRWKDLLRTWKQILMEKFAIFALLKEPNPGLFLRPEFLADLRSLAKWIRKFRRAKVKMFLIFAIRFFPRHLFCGRVRPENSIRRSLPPNRNKRHSVQKAGLRLSEISWNSIPHLSVRRKILVRVTGFNLLTEVFIRISAIGNMSDMWVLPKNSFKSVIRI